MANKFERQEGRVPGDYRDLDEAGNTPEQKEEIDVDQAARLQRGRELMTKEAQIRAELAKAVSTEASAALESQLADIELAKRRGS